MNKTELVAKMADLSGLTKTDTEKSLNAFISAVESTLASKDDVRLVGFGTFTTSKRKAGEGRNPRTGEPIKIAESTLVKFKSGKRFKSVVNGN